MKLEKKSLFSSEVYQECLDRINKISSEMTPAWGKMSSAQMFAHCAEIQEVANGKALENTPFFIKLIKGIIRKAVVNDKPYRKESPTHPQYVVANSRDFIKEKQRLLDALKEFYETDPAKAATQPHPFFGPMTADEKGWSMYKHLDHHLSQFGV